jgi:hypothetical protein
MMHPPLPLAGATLADGMQADARVQDGHIAAVARPGGTPADGAGCPKRSPGIRHARSCCTLGAA